MVFKYHIKICSKNNHKEKRNSLEIMNWHNPQQTQLSFYRSLKWSSESFHISESVARVCTKIILHIGNYNILQYNFQAISQSGCKLAWEQLKITLKANYKPKWILANLRYNQVWFTMALSAKKWLTWNVPGNYLFNTYTKLLKFNISWSP